jgi:hypothetical protein
MADLMPAAPRRKPWLKYFGISALVAGLLSICWYVGSEILLFTNLTTPMVAPFFGGVPQISGTVVDAVTGQPVSEMDVCLIALSRGIGGTGFDRRELTQSDATGKFSFASSTQKGFGFAGYEIGISDPAAHLGPSCGTLRDMLTNPNIVVGEGLPSREDNKRKGFYFPVVLVQGIAKDPYDQTRYGPMLQTFTEPGNIRIALIPLLLDESECEPVNDRTNAGFCHWLNSSSDAVLLRKQDRPLAYHR